MLGHRKLVVYDYLLILKRRWWIIVVPSFVGLIAAIAITFVVQPSYTSQTLVLIDKQQVPDDYVKPVISSDLDARLASMKEQILSRSRLQPIIEKYNLYSSEHMSVDNKIDAVRKSIGIRAIHSEITDTGGLPGFFISFTASDPHTAQLVCSEVTSLFLNENLRSREASAEGTTDFLKEQLLDAKRSLDEQDAKLATFQREHFGKLPGDENSNLGVLATLNTQLEAANQALQKMEQDRTYMQTLMSQLTPNGGPLPASVLVPNTQRTAKDSELQTLQNEEADMSMHYTADYPDLIALRRKIAALRKQIADMPASVPAGSPSASGASSSAPALQQLKAQMRAADQAIEAKRLEQSQLQKTANDYQGRIQSSPEVEAEYKQLTRDYSTAQAFYADLLAKINQSKMATDLEIRQEGEQFRVMDKANLPESPTYPKRGVFAGGGVAAGLALGLLIVGFLEYRNTALRTEQDVWEFTQLPTLAIITLKEDLSGSPKNKKTDHEAIAINSHA